MQYAPLVWKAAAALLNRFLKRQHISECFLASNKEIKLLKSVAYCIGRFPAIHLEYRICATKFGVSLAQVFFFHYERHSLLSKLVV